MSRDSQSEIVRSATPTDPARKGLGLLRATAALILLGLLIAVIDWTQLQEAASHLSTWAIVFLLAISGVLIYLSSLKWHFFLKSLGDSPGVGHLFGLYLVGYFVNSFLPSMIGGDVVRSMYAGRKSDVASALTATVLERYTGIVALIALGLATVWFTPNAHWQIRLAMLLMGGGLLAITACALGEGPLRLLKNYPKLSRFSKILEKIHAGLQLARANRPLLATALFLSLLYHLVGVLNVYVAGVAVGWAQPPVLELFVVLPLILCIGAIPLTPNGLGLQEGAYVFFLLSVGATKEQALLIALVLRAKTVILGLIGGLVWLRVRATKSEPMVISQ